MSLERINRRGASALRHFVSGKVISMLLTLGYFILLTRHLAVGDYADYVTAIAIAEILIGITTFGLDWLAAIRIPETAPDDKTELARLVRRLLSARLSTLGAFFLLAAALVFPASFYFDWMIVAALGLCLALVEGLNRYVATAVFDTALQQRASKRMWIGKALLQLLAVTVILVAAPALLTAETVIVIEACGSLAGLLIAAPALRQMLRPVPLAVQPALLREGISTFASHWPTVSASYAGSLLSWAGSISTFVVMARILGGETVGAVVGFCASLTNQVRRYLPTEMFLGVVRAFIYARFARHRSTPLLEQDLHLFFGIGMAAVILATSLLSLIGEPVIELLSNGKFTGALPLVLLSVGGLTGMVGRRIVETGANALAATDIWAAATTRALLVLPLACLIFHVTGQSSALILGWVAVDLLTTAVLHLQLARHRAIRAIPVALVARSGILLPVLALGFWSVHQSQSMLQHAVIASLFFVATGICIGKMGFISLATAKQMFKAGKA